MELQSQPCNDTGNARTFQDQVFHRLLEDCEARLIFQQAANGLPVQLPVRLRTGGADGRALARIQGAELDAGPVDRSRHGAAQSVNFPRQVSLADAADGRIAAHLAERSDVLGDEKGAGARARGSERRFRAGVSTAYDDDIKARVGCHSQYPGQDSAR